MPSDVGFYRQDFRPNVGSYVPPEEMSPVETDENDTKRSAWLKLAREAYSASTTYFDKSVRPDVLKDLRQFQGMHQERSKYLSEAWRGKSSVFRPKTRAMIRKGEAQAANSFFSTLDVVSITPVDGENPLCRAAALVFQGLTQHYLSIKPQRWFLKLIGAYQVAMNSGVVVSYQGWHTADDRSIDRPDVRLVPVENFRFDPAADWTDPAATSPYLIELLPMRAMDVRARAEEGKWFPVTAGELAKSATTYDSIRQAREQRRTDPYDMQEVGDYTIVWVHRNIVNVGGLDVEFYTLGTEQLLSDPRPVAEVYPHGRPYVIGTCIVDAFKAYPDSLCKLTRDVQAEINDLANMRLENIKLVLNKRYIVKRNQNVDLQSLTRNVAGSVTLVSNTDDVRTDQTGDVTGSSFAEQDRLNVEMDDLGGAFSGASVASNRKLNETVGGMNLLSASSTQVGEYQLRTFVETWVEPVIQQVVELIRAYCADPTLLMLAGNSKELQQLGFDQVTEEMLQQEVVVSVNVGTGAVNPAAKVERMVFALGTVLKLAPALADRIKPEEIIGEIMGSLGYKDGARFFDMEQENPMQQMVQQLEIKIKEAQLAKLTAETAAKNVEALYSAIQTGSTALQVPGVTPVADAIAKSAGFVDHDQPPIYPDTVGAQRAVPLPNMPGNTSPMFPGNPDVGMMRGIEGGQE